jgi:hypothetical protein
MEAFCESAYGPASSEWKHCVSETMGLHTSEEKCSGSQLTDQHIVTCTLWFASEATREVT